jgi:hypothetical protein
MPGKSCYISDYQPDFSGVDIRNKKTLPGQRFCFLWLRESSERGVSFDF